MSRILFVSQEKGGVGKSILARALAEAIPDAPVLEIDSSPRLLELGDRVKFFPMRADRAAIERTGGRVSRAEFDAVIGAISTATQPTIVDVGANTSTSFLALLADLAPDLREAGVDAGVLVVVTAEPGALAEAPGLLRTARQFAGKFFVVENRLRGAVDPKELKKLAGDAVVTALAEQAIEEKAMELLQAGGFASVPKLDAAKLNAAHGLSLGSRIRRDLTRFRLEAMEAARPAAEWLVGT